VPEAERERISEVLLRILNGSLFELDRLARERRCAAAAARRGHQPLHDPGGAALSDASLLPRAAAGPAEADFEQVQASVFQVARAPGKKLVYLGAVLLIVGVFAMLYIRERRLWVWLAPADGGGTTAGRLVHHPPHAGRGRRIRAC
jgi:cytochrome c biogenesis protein